MKTIFLLILFIISGSVFAQYQSPEIKVQIGHNGIVNQVKLSPDGKLVLSCSWDKTIKLWEAATGRLVRTYEGHTNTVNYICFSPDGNTFFSSGEDELIINWDVSTGNILNKFKGYGGHISVSPNGKILATIGNDGIILMDASSGEIIKNIEMYVSHSVSKLDFSPDGNYIISCAFKELKMWSVSDGSLVREFEKNNYQYYSPVFSPDGKMILTGSGDRIIRLMDASSGKLIRTFEGHDSRVFSVAFSPDGKYILSGSDDRTVVLWDILNSQVVSSFNSHNEDVFSVCFSSDGKYVISSSATEIMLSESETGRYIRSFEGHTSAISSSVYTPDGKFILTGCFDKTLKLWEASSGKLVSTFEGHTDLVKSVAVSPDGIYALSGSADNTVKLWEISTAKLLKTFEGHNELVTSVAFSPDGNFAASASWDNNVNLWSVSTGKLLKTFEGHKWYVTSVAFSPDGKYLLSGSFDNNVILWDIAKNKPFKIFESANRIETVTFSPDGKKILSGSCDNSLALWDIASEKIIKYFDGHSDYISSAVFTSDGKNILSGSQDKTMKLWDVATGKTLKTFEGHSSRLMSVCLSPDNKYAVSTSADNKMKLWDLKSGTELVNLITYSKKDYMVMTPDNYYLCSKNGVKVIAFVIGNHAYPPEQFDLQYNRPDVVLKRIGLVDEDLIDAYHKAYLKRLKKLNFNEDMFNKDFQLPEIKLLTEKIPLTTENKNLSLKIKANDSKYNLDKLNVYINNVPVFGSTGINLRDNVSTSLLRDITLELSKKKNKVQVSVLNEKGAESLSEDFDINFETNSSKPNLYVLTIGASDYNDSKYKLKYASKDANDVANLMTSHTDKYNDIKILKILDKDVNKENILKAKEFLMNTKIDDEVIIFIAGHGLLSKDYDYYFATSDIDFVKPELKGITFDEIESLLDGIPARKKVLFVDTCHSGEVDKEEIKEVKKKKVETGEVVFRSVGETEYVSKDEKKFGLKNITQLLQDMFVDLRHSSGSIVISSSGGLEFAWEGGDYKNGLFTYSLLEGLKTGNADLNHDGEITIGELREYVSNMVEKLTKGAQKPTSRRDNLDLDFVIW